MLKIIKAEEPLLVERVNMCLYSAPGLGKTSLAFTADDPLLLNFDKGAHRAAVRRDTVTVDSWKDVAAMTKEDFDPYKTVGVDTAGRALDFLTADIIAGNPKLGYGGSLNMQGWGQLKSRFTSWLKLLNSFGKDVILVAHMDEQRSGDDVIERLDVQGGSKGEIYKSVDAMGRIFIDNQNRRVLDFSPRQNSFGKNPCGLEPMLIPDPRVDGQFLGRLLRDIKTRLNQMTAEQQDARSVIEEWTEALKDFTEPDDFNRMLDELATAPLPVKALAAKKARELGFVFNKTAKLYEGIHVTA